MKKEAYYIPFVEGTASQFERDRESALNNWLYYRGEKDVYEKRQKEGYTHVRFGGGPWFYLGFNDEKYFHFVSSSRVETISGPDGMQYLSADALRIVDIAIFYHPDGSIATFEHIKYRSAGWGKSGPTIEAEFSTIDDFDKFIDEFGIELLPKMSLKKVNKLWQKVTNPYPEDEV